MSTPKTIVIKTEPSLKTVRLWQPSRTVVLNRIGDQGPIGPRGPGVFVSATPPENPILNDIWIDISAA